jgi:hypothetical protein
MAAITSIINERTKKIKIVNKDNKEEIIDSISISIDDIRYCSKIYWDIIDEAEKNIGLFGGFTVATSDTRLQDIIKNFKTSDCATKTEVTNRMKVLWKMEYKETCKTLDSLEAIKAIKFLNIGKNKHVLVLLNEENNEENTASTKEAPV